MNIKPFIEHPNADENGYTTETIKIGWSVYVGHVPDSFNGYYILIQGATGEILVNMDKVQMTAIRDAMNKAIEE